MSAFKILAAGLACAAPLASAYTKPVGDSPSGNAISQPGLNSIVPVGKGFTVTWEPTKKDCETVDLVLLKGPASDAEPQYAIAEKIDNDGSFAWTPKTDLAPSDSATPAMGYGIQLICDKSGAYQYTTQFGISNPDYKKKEVSSTSAPSAPAAYTTPSSVHTSASAVKPAHVSITASAAPYHAGNSTTMTGTAPAVTGGVVPTGYKAGNSSMVGPTGSAANMSTTLATSATLSASGSGSMASASASASSAVPSSGAAQLATSIGSLVIAAGVAVYAL